VVRWFVAHFEGRSRSFKSSIRYSYNREFDGYYGVLVSYDRDLVSDSDIDDEE